MRVLIVEDDPDISNGVETALRHEGYQTETAFDGDEGQKMALFNSYGVILLDLMLPKKDGREVCRELRAAGVATPILMMTARDDVPDRVEGLQSGADDYLVKPFAIEELLARVMALARRDNVLRAAKLSLGDIELDTTAQTVTVSGNPVQLTQREFALLEALLRNQGRVLTRETILERVFNNDEALPNTVNFHMSSLRKKVDPESKWIHTVHGFGYTARS